MNIRTRLKRGVAAGAAAAVSLGLASMAPRPKIAEPDCLPVAVESVETPKTYHTPADRRAANFGAFLLGYLAEKCGAHGRDETVTTAHLGNGAVRLALTREVGTNVEGGERGGYYIEVVTAANKEGLQPASITSYHVSQTATMPGEGPLATYSLSAKDVNTGWILRSDERTKRYGGGMVEGNTGASLSDGYTEQIIAAAAEVVAAEDAGRPTDYATIH